MAPALERDEVLSVATFLTFLTFLVRRDAECQPSDEAGEGLRAAEGDTVSGKKRNRGLRAGSSKRRATTAARARAMGAPTATAAGMSEGP